MMPSETTHVVRPVVNDLLTAEDILRRVRRSIIADAVRPQPPLEAPASELIRNVIGVLVRANLAIEAMEGPTHVQD